MKGKSYYKYKTKKTDKYKSAAKESSTSTSSFTSTKSKEEDYYNYRYNNWEKDGEEELIDPYSVLNVSAFPSIEEVRSAYMKLATCPLRSVRRNACLAYDIFCNKEKYRKIGNEFTVIKKDAFYYATIGDLDKLKCLIENNKNLLYEKDKLQRNLLYIAARNGYFNVTEYLLKKGININDTQSSGSTALHGAAYYGQELVIQLLIEHGIDTKIKNKFGHTAADEARTPFIKESILNSHQDRIMNLFHNLKSKNLVSNIVPIKKKDKIIALKLLCTSIITNKYLLNETKNWIPGWHGTKFQYLESIIRYGLRPSGSKLSNGVSINVNPGHIPLSYSVSGIKFWAKAVFVSPSIFYASNPVYSERINSCSERWCVLVEVRIKPGSYTSHPSTVLKYAGVKGEPGHVEYRINVQSDKDLIYRVPSSNNIYVTSITFVKAQFLENINYYYEGNIVINSKEERMLLEN